MPVHVIDADEHRPFREVITEAVAAIERREEIIDTEIRGGQVLIFTKKRVGRPAKETR